MLDSQLNAAILAVLDGWNARGVKINWQTGRVWFPEYDLTRDLEINLNDAVWVSLPADAVTEDRLGRFVFSYIYRQQSAIEAGETTHA